MNKWTISILSLLLFNACEKKEPELFDYKDEGMGLEFTNQIEETDDLNILDYLYFYNGGGVAIGDVNNDGLPDLYFSGNQVKNKLFLNKGNLQFEDVTDRAGVAGESSWNTGTVMADVNGDGYLDIYVCAVVGINGFGGYNELFINQGDGSFKEEAKTYGLDIEAYSSTATFFDYDRDGDLDLYLLNHAVHTQESFGKADLREKRNAQTGDRLFRNDGDTFTDVSEEAGIFGGVNGYGLSVATADFNQDGFPDLYVGNDFHEDDYYYLNQGDGTFKEVLKAHFGHTARFTMGSDAADINGDGFPDILSLDMLPEDEAVLKASDGDESLQVLRMRVKNYGYHYQFTRNMLQINRPGGQFQETALLSGIAATDWSWSGLFADYDGNGTQDLFVSNGIPKRPNNLDFIKFISNEQIQKKINNTRLVDQEALEMMPSGKANNYIFSGDGTVAFEDKSAQWKPVDSLISGATAYADLDLDGDLDLVVNNLNEKSGIFLNKTDGKRNYLNLSFDYKKGNTLGIGTKVFLYTKGKLQFKELYPSKGFQASSEPKLFFGLDSVQKVDSIRLVWPDGSAQLMRDVAANQSLKLAPENNVIHDLGYLFPERDSVFQLTEDNLGLDFVHEENNYNDFNVQKLIPYMVTDRGPATAVGDLDGDGAQDVYFGGSINKASKVYLQSEEGFKAIKSYTPQLQDSMPEIVTALIEDFNKDGQSDLFLGTGGADFYKSIRSLSDQYYQRDNDQWLAETLPEFFSNTSVIKAADVDGDQDLDLFIGNHVVSKDFGKLPNSYLLINENGRFTIQQNPDFEGLGMVTDAEWLDLNADGALDLVVVAEWSSPLFFLNQGGRLVKTDLMKSPQKGLWQEIQAFDIDQDGDLDLLLGNWGLNTKFNASPSKPLKMYHGDFDGNRRKETLLAQEKDGAYYPVAGLDELANQMVKLKRKYTSYKDFAGKSIDEIFEAKTLDSAEVFEVNQMASGYLLNDKGKFSFKAFDWPLQVSPITSFLKYDFDKDGTEEVLAAGNYFGIKPYHGRFDGLEGQLIKSTRQNQSAILLGMDLSGKSVRHLNIIMAKGKPYLLVTVNNAKAEVYALPKYN